MAGGGEGTVSGVGGAGGCEIALQNPNRYREAGARRLRPWLADLLAAVAPAAGSLAVRFSSDRAMRQVNRDFRGHDKTTDVLSFPGDLAAAGGRGAHGGGDGHLGDILISVPTARRQAAAAGHAVETELRVLVLHGVLHCLGYDHEADDGEMERLERRLRRRFLAAGAADAAVAADAAGAARAAERPPSRRRQAVPRSAARAAASGRRRAR